MPPSNRRRNLREGEQLAVIKDLVSNGQYHLSRKVYGFVAEGWYGNEDLERCILTATSIHKVEPDERGDALDGCKYTILGRDTQGQTFYTCGKIVLAEDDQRLYFFITAHEAG